MKQKSNAQQKPGPVGNGFQNILYGFDEPLQDLPDEKLLTVRGWCFSVAKETKISGVRVRCGSLKVSGKRQQTRLEVAAAYPKFPQALKSGFTLEWAPPFSLWSKEYSIELRVDGVWFEIGRVQSRRPLLSATEKQEPERDYSEWVRCHDTLSPKDRQAIRQHIEEVFPEPPLLAVLMPVYNAPLEYLRRALESVRDQLYPNWELCIADDASEAPEIQQFLAEYQEADGRIKVVYRDLNGHISEASNSALAMISASHFALLDQDDELPAHALYHVALELLEAPDATLIYSDEDKIDENGTRSDPYFKSDWNPELLRAQNCVSHLGVFRTETVRDIGGFRRELEGSQDWDLALRVVEKSRPEQIRHIPRVLYHWRCLPGSTAISGSEKPYAISAGQRAVQEHLARCGVQATVEHRPTSFFQVHYALPAKAPRVTLIIPFRDRVSLLQRCLETLFEHTDYPDWEVLLVDNESQQPETKAYLREMEKNPRVRVISCQGSFNFAQLNNEAVQETDADLVGLLNNDLEFRSTDWLSKLAAMAWQPESGAVGARLVYPDLRLQHGGIFGGYNGVAGHLGRGTMQLPWHLIISMICPRQVLAVTAACMLVRRDRYLEVGGMDAEHLAVSFNDVDFCLRLHEAGYRNVINPDVTVVHHESASRGLSAGPTGSLEAEWMQKRWGPILYKDPFFNPNLDLDESGQLAFPPRVPTPWEKWLDAR